MERKYNVGDFIKKANEIHKGKYNYSKAVYINNKTNICIICPEHGEFWQRPKDHLNGSGCPKCTGNKKMNTDEFIKRAKEVHGDKYDYSKTEYVNSRTKVCIIDKEIGEFFQFPMAHLKGYIYKNKHRNRKSNISNEEYIERVKKVHGNRYDYSKTEFKSMSQKIRIICHKHGEFSQEAKSHLNGVGCPSCHNSHLEDEVKMFLEKNGIKYIEKCDKKQFTWLGRQHLDFYLPDLNIAIECQGEQHFIPVKNFGGEKRFKKRNELDILKNNLCKEHNIKMKYFSHCNYTQFLGEELIKNVENIIN